MIFILFFLSAGFVFISHGLDKFSMSKHVSEKHFPTIQFIAKLFLSFALQLTILALVQFLVIETTQFNICAYLFSVKYIHLLLCGYVLIFIYKKISLNAQWEKSLLYRQYTTQPSKSDPTLEYRTFWCHYTIGNIGEKTIYSKKFLSDSCCTTYFK